MTEEKRWTAEEYGELAGFDGDWRDSWWNQDFLELMARRWDLADVRRVLDVGCGHGHWGQRLATLISPEAEIVGVDHEEGFLEAARERSRRWPQRFEYRQGSAMELPFEDGAFDLVTCQTVLIHVPDAAAAIREMTRVVRPGGLVIAVEPNNLVEHVSQAAASPGRDIEETLAILRFDAICHAGKRATGHGDHSVGEHLPGLLADAGLEGIRVYQNDRCPALFGACDAPDQVEQVKMMRQWTEAEISSWGRREDARPTYLAGGGDPAAFDAGFDRLIAAQRAWLEAIDGGRLSASSGFLLYLVSGRKPR